MTRFVRWLRSLRQPLPWLVGGAILIFFLLLAVTVGATAWEYTNSPQFCGTTCHTMPPEYTAYKISPHARVPCVDCHLGQETILLTVPRKAKEIGHVINAFTKRYEPPIYVKSLRPARDICEKCHNPEKFSSDTFVELKRYAEDETNTESRIFLIVKTGGGSRREGLGRGIHWHIESEVWFYSDDPLKQTIPYVREVTPQGKTIEYFDVEAGLPPDFGQKVEGQLHRMDCIDCHTRISHLFRSPEDAMDDALARHQIDASIPYIKKKGVQVLSQKYSSTEEGLQAIRELENWYQQNYPDFYKENDILISKAIQAIQEIFTVSVFPNMGVGWQTHPNNVGHKEFPGCFRCHDGKHTSPQGKTIRLECNLCHSIPEVVEANQAAPVLSIDKPGEPKSHKDSNWLARHRYVFDQTCATCHDVSNPGGTDNSSFCSNSACHGTNWQYVGLNAPAIRKLVAPPRVPGSGQPRSVPHPIGPRTDCKRCHGLDAVHPYPENHTSFEPTLCTQCHQPSLLEQPQVAEAPASSEGASEVTPTAPTTAQPPPVPHSLEARQECLICHSEQGFKPFPADHAGRTTETCLLCHKTTRPQEGKATLTATQTATSTPRPAIATPTPSPTLAAATPAPTATATPTRTSAGPTATATATATRAEATTTPTEEAATPTATLAAVEVTPSGPPAVPHTLEGRDNCLLCHGTEGLKPYPSDHEGRTVDTCLLCHPVAEQQ